MVPRQLEYFSLFNIYFTKYFELLPNLILSPELHRPSPAISAFAWFEDACYTSDHRFEYEAVGKGSNRCSCFCIAGPRSLVIYPDASTQDGAIKAAPQEADPRLCWPYRSRTFDRQRLEDQHRK